MTTDTIALPDLGWGPFYQSQLTIDEFETTQPVRISGVHRTAIDVLASDGPSRVNTTPDFTSADLTVGDWLLIDQATGDPVRLLDRKSLLQRMAAGTDTSTQLIAANIDTLFIVTSCNADFNIARLERYLALAHQAEVEPVIILTKPDLCDDPDAFLDQAREGMPNTLVELVNAKSADAVAQLAPWCGKGQTVALLGSSGVGKSTLVNKLSGADQDTQGIREDDARGRHTTTGRSLHRISGGGWLMDTPGMRSLRLYDLKDGVDAVFEDIVDLATTCKFSDCAHDTEPGCAVQNAIKAGDLDEGRLHRWQKLQREDARHAETVAEQHAQSRKKQKHYATGKLRMKEKQRGLD